MKILEKIKKTIFGKYIQSIVRNSLQYGFGFLTGALSISLVKYGASPEDVASLLKELSDLQLPLEKVMLPISGSLLTLALSLFNAKRSK